MQSSSKNSPRAMATITLEEAEILTSVWHQQRSALTWTLVLSLRLPGGQRFIRLYDVDESTDEARLILKQEIPDCFSPSFICKVKLPADAECKHEMNQKG